MANKTAALDVRRTPAPWYVNTKIRGHIYVEGVKGGFVCDMQADEHMAEYDAIVLQVVVWGGLAAWLGVWVWAAVR